MSLTIILTSLLMVAIIPDVAEANFTATCRDINLRSTSVTAECANEQGNYSYTFIRLNRHVGRNQDGHLIWQERGNFSRHCRHHRIIYDSRRNHTLLRGRCTLPNYIGYRTSELNLDERIFNQNGRLVYVAP